MRLNEAADTEMTLGKDAIERGALCHEIDRNMPGTAYALVDGTPEAVRLRFPWISDDDIREMAQFYRPNPANPTSNSSPEIVRAPHRCRNASSVQLAMKSKGGMP